MPRPHSAPGGRPHRITIRLSTAEKAELDQARGAVAVNDYVRTHLFSTRRPSAVIVPEEPVAAKQTATTPPPPACEHEWKAGNLFDLCAKCDERRRHVANYH